MREHVNEAQTTRDMNTRGTREVTRTGTRKGEGHGGTNDMQDGNVPGRHEGCTACSSGPGTVTVGVAAQSHRGTSNPLDMVDLGVKVIG